MILTPLFIRRGEIGYSWLLFKLGLNVMWKGFFSMGVLLLSVTLSGLLWADEVPAVPDSAPLLRESGALLGEFQTLINERELAHEGEPLNQLSVFVSLRPNKHFKLESVQLKIDDTVVATHTYSADEVAALTAGGSHHLWVEQLKPGMHELLASWRGEANDKKDSVREIRWAFRSGETRRLVELELSQDKEQSFPQFSLREWH